MFNGSRKAMEEVVTMAQMLPKDEVTDTVAASLIAKIEECKDMPEEEFFAGLTPAEIDAFIDYVNPKKNDGTRTYTSDEYIRTKEDLTSCRKIIMSCQAMRVKLGDPVAVANQANLENLQDQAKSGNSFVNKIGKFVKTKVFLGIVAGALLVSTALSTSLGIAYTKSRQDYKDLESRHEFVLKDRDDAFKALKQFGVDFSYDENSSLSDVIGSVAEGTKKQHKQEVDQAYAMVVKVFNDNGITLEDIYNEETGEYDVSKLDESMGTVVEELVRNTANLKALEGQVESTLKVVKIPKRDEAGNPIREDGEIVYKTIEDYETLADAIEDIGKNYQQSLDAEIASIGAVVDQNLDKLGAEKSVKDFATINDAINYLGEVGGSKIGDLQSKLESQVETISKLRSELGDIQSDYDKVMQENQDLQQKVKDLQEKETSNTNQNVSDGSSKGDSAEPVGGEEKGDDNNGGESRPDGKNNGGSDLGFDSDEKGSI